jgi:hypothetical protein
VKDTTPGFLQRACGERKPETPAAVESDIIAESPKKEVSMTKLLSDPKIS